LPVLKVSEVYFGKKIYGTVRMVLVHVACVGVQLRNFKQIDRLEDTDVNERNIEMYLKEMGWEVVDCINLAAARRHWSQFVMVHGDLGGVHEIRELHD
jgi:hypothetical protein